jgi:hypothetical protein
VFSFTEKASAVKCKVSRRDRWIAHGVVELSYVPKEARKKRINKRREGRPTFRVELFTIFLDRSLAELKLKHTSVGGGRRW